MARQMTYCGFCRRLTGERTEAGPASNGQEEARSKDNLSLPGTLSIQETYCHECDQFYHQLVTFGRGDAHSTDGGRPEPRAQENTRSVAATRLPA